MKKIFYLFSLSSFLFLFSSCQDVVQIKLDEGSKLYVIDAFLNDLPGIQTIRISTNDNYFSNREAPGVAGAQVVLRDLTTNMSHNFTYSNNGNYVFYVDSTHQIGFVDHQYELSVTIDGQTYTSLAIQKRTASIDSVSVETPEQAGGGFGPPQKDTTFFCNLYAKDKTDANTDYYWVKTFRNDTLLFGPNDINISIDGTNGPVNAEGLDSTDFTPPVSYLNFDSFHRRDVCEVQIHSISKETYFFFLQAATQITNGGLFATTPENVKTNVITPSGATTKAIGWFNMASVVRNKIVIP